MWFVFEERVMRAVYDPCEIEAKWQKAWDEAGVFQPEVDEREKFFITVPYPYLNGNLHVGHTRTFTIGDVVARYRRMQGYNVLYPMGFHVTGTPIVGLAELIARRDPQTMEVYHRFHDIPMDVLTGLNTPEKIVEYFSTQAESDMRSIGYSIDWRRRFTTTDESYKRFITWQFNLLHRLGYVVKGSHPVRWCPNDDNPVEDHDILRGESATIVDYTLIKFRIEGSNLLLPCATLRPETVFGVTNLWANPEAEYVQVEVTLPGGGCEEWIVSREACEKLRFTDKKVVFKRKVLGAELVGVRVVNPVDNKSVLVLPASFVDPGNGSGIVMSVPAHAPYDYLALRDLFDADLSRYGIQENPRDIKPVSLIKVPDFGEYPAVEVVEKLGVKNQEDPLAEEATKLVYRREFHNGVLTKTTGKYAGIKVSKIKEVLTQDLIQQGIADVFYEFSEQPVVCRCGTRCVVKMVENQWFLNYSNPEWKAKVYRCLENMEIYPPELRVEFENKVDWLRDKACARRKGLGTPLPWGPQWLIESLADSTIYMSYYILSKFIAQGLSPEQLTEDLFDYTLLGKGEVGAVSEHTGIPVETLLEMRRDFNYWYPVDLRSSGKDLIPNHLLFFLFHHTAIYPESMWPRGVAINGFVSLEGEKMSKSRGPLLTMKSAVRDYGADVTRLYILSTAEHTQDADWRQSDVESARRQLERFYRIAGEIIAMPPGSGGEPGNIDRWLISRLQHRVAETNDALEKLQTRRALQHSFYLLLNDLRWYERRGGRQALPELLHTWTRLLAPFIPHVCEEIWSHIGTGFVSLAAYPVPEQDKIDTLAEQVEAYVQRVLEDVEEILRITGITPQRVILYTAPDWKHVVYQRALQLKLQERLEMGVVMKEVMKNPDVRKHGKDVSRYVQRLIAELKGVTREAAELLLEGPIEEERTLEENREFFEREFGCSVVVQRAEQPDFDPEGRSRHAEPGRPAIYVVQDESEQK